MKNPIQHHWSINTTELEKDPEKFAIWRLEQWINWGIGSSAKVKRVDLIAYWDKLDIDEWKRKALALALF
jgi:hypothetical protein